MACSSVLDIRDMYADYNDVDCCSVWYSKTGVSLHVIYLRTPDFIGKANSFVDSQRSRIFVRNISLKTLFHIWPPQRIQ